MLWGGKLLYAFLSLWKLFGKSHFSKQQDDLPITQTLLGYSGAREPAGRVDMAIHFPFLVLLLSTRSLPTRLRSGERTLRTS